MASTERTMNDVTVSLVDLDVSDLGEIIKHLPDVSISEILESNTLYKLALIYAARGLHEKFMRKMALSGVGMKTTDVLGQMKVRNDISKAFQRNDFDAVRKLLEFDENKDVMKDKSGYDLISAAIFCDCPPAFLEFVIQLFGTVNNVVHKKCVVNGCDNHGLTPLIAAVLAGKLGCVQMLLDQGADINIPDSHWTKDPSEKTEDEETSPKRKEKEEKEKTLFFKKDSLYGLSKTALMYAICTKNIECVKILLRFKPDMKRKCLNGLTAIGYAVIASDYDCLNLLLTTPVKMDKSELMGGAANPDQGDSSAKFNHIVIGDSFDFTAVPERNKKDSGKPWLSNLEKRATCLKRKKDWDGTVVLGNQESEQEDLGLSDSDRDSDRDSTGGQSDESNADSTSSLRRQTQENLDLNDSDSDNESRNGRSDDNNAVSTSDFVDSLRRKIPATFRFGDKPLKQAAEPDNEATSNSNSEDKPFSFEFGKGEDKPFSFEFGKGFSFSQPKFTIGDFTPKSGVRFPKPKNKLKHNVKNSIFKEISDVKNMDVRAIAEASLPFAINGDDIQCLKLLINHCGNLGCMDKFGKTPLILAAEKGKTDYVELLLKSWAGVDSPVSLGVHETALMLASQNGHIECVNLLLQYNADVNGVNWCKETALVYSVKHGRVECLKRLLEHKANVHELNAKGQTPLMIAAENGKTECFELLLKSGAKISESDWCQKSVLTYAAESGNSDIVELVFETVIKDNETKRSEISVGSSDKDNEKSTELKHSEECLKSYSKPIPKECRDDSETRVSPGDDDDSKSDSSEDMFGDVSESKRRQVYQKTIEEEDGAKNMRIDAVVNPVSMAEKSLPYAVRGGNMKCIEMLLVHCKDYNQTEIMTKKTALMLAAEKELVECVQLLVKHGADVNFICEGRGMLSDGTAGTSAVTCATLFQKKECLQLLLESGADPNRGIDLFSKKTAIMIATCNRDRDCMKLLMKHGANALMEDEDSQSAFTYALEARDMESLRVIFSEALKLDIVDFYETEKFNRILKYPEGLEFLLKEGFLTMSKEADDPYGDRATPYFHRDQQIGDGVQILMKYGMFDWKASCTNEYDAFTHILFCALRAGISPQKFYSDGKLVSPMQFVFSAYESDFILRYLLSNLYLTLDDYRLFTSEHGQEEPPDMSFLESDLVTTCLRNPWRLETLCLLTASDCLSNSATSSPRLPRTKRVDSLPIPEKFKTILKYNGAHSRLCKENWNCIGKPPNGEGLSNNILCLTKPVYPISMILSECDDCHCPFKGKGVKIK